MSHRFQLRHLCDHRQVAESLACNGWARGRMRGSRSGRFPAARLGRIGPLAEEHWRQASISAPARGTFRSRRASY